MDRRGEVRSRATHRFALTPTLATHTVSYIAMSRENIALGWRNQVTGNQVQPAEGNRASTALVRR